jgi:hypothetical protein
MLWRSAFEEIQCTHHHFITPFTDDTHLPYCHQVIFDEKYVQSNFIKYYLLTPKSLREAPRVGTSWYFTNQTVEGSGLQISTLNFTGIQSDEIRSLRDELQHYVDNYPDRNTTMSVNIGERNGMVELSITHYDSGDEK